MLVLLVTAYPFHAELQSFSPILCRRVFQNVLLLLQVIPDVISSGRALFLARVDASIGERTVTSDTGHVVGQYRDDIVAIFVSQLVTCGSDLFKLLLLILLAKSCAT